MKAPLRRTLLCLLVAALAVLAHGPLFRSGFVGGDLELLAAAAETRAPDDASSAWLAQGEVRPIPAAVLRAHAGLHAGLSPLEPAVAAPYFALTIAVLLVAAAGAGVTLRRVLVPWLGESAARAAGWACAGLIVAHPATVPAVARPAALGDLLALAAGTWCTAFFLRGRQQRRDRFLVLAALLAIAAGFASSAAWMLPFACAALEFTSAHRPRKLGRRVAAAATVALVAVVAVAIEAAFAWPHRFGFREGTPWMAYAHGLPRHEFDFASHTGFEPVAALNALGVMFVPVPSPGAAAAFFACVALLLLASEPLLRAVRAAPRLWGWLVLGWLGAAALTLFLARDLALTAGRIELGHALVSVAFIVCAALAAASTALGGSRRTVVPLAVAAGLCILSDRTSRLWPERSRELLALRSDLERGLATAGHGIVYVVGVRDDDARPLTPRTVLQAHLGVPNDLDLVAGMWPPVASRGRLRRARAGAIPYALRLPALDAARREGLAVLLLDREERPVFRVPAPSGEARTATWRDDRENYGKSPTELTFDPLALTMLRVTPRAGISTAEPPRMRWRARNPTFEHGSIAGAWVATDQGPQAIFDLGRSLEWALGERVLRIWFEGELGQFVTAELLPRIDLELEASARYGTEMGRVPLDKRPRAWTGDVTWRIARVDPEDGAFSLRECVELDGERISCDSVNFSCFPNNEAARFLECCVGEVTVARSADVDRTKR